MSTIRSSVLIAGIALLFAAYSPAAEPESPITKEAVRKAISLFRQDPLSPQGRAAGEVVRTFAEKSEDVILHVTPKLAPFLSNVQFPERDRALLLNAFMVGSVDSQLLRNEKMDDPYAGVLEVISTYRRMQTVVPTINLPEVQKLIDLEKRDELKEYVASP
jgi:hypothetical protein